MLVWFAIIDGMKCTNDLLGAAFEVIEVVGDVAIGIRVLLVKDFHIVFVISPHGLQNALLYARGTGYGRAQRSKADVLQTTNTCKSLQLINFDK